MKKTTLFAKKVVSRQTPHLKRCGNSRRIIQSLSSLLLFLSLIVFSLNGIGQKSSAFIPLTVPVQLRIPIINVDAPIEAVGVSADGTMSSPVQDLFGDVGWYDAGPCPGQQGSAVIDGHLDRPGGSPAVFWRLQELHVGNEVDIMNSNKKTVRFRVVNIKYYQPQNAPLHEIFEKEDGTYLNLETSAGYWIPSQRQTTLRLVIYTTLFQ